MFTLVSDLRAAGLKVGLLSNSWGNTYPRDRIDGAFDHIVISGEVGMRKPEAEIYALSVQGLEVQPETAVFVDDLARNIDAARAAGLQAIHHTDATTTRQRLEEIIPALRAHGETP